MNQLKWDFQNETFKRKGIKSDGPHGPDGTHGSHGSHALSGLVFDHGKFILGSDLRQISQSNNRPGQVDH